MSHCIALNEDAAPEPGYVQELADGAAEIIRILCRLTRHHEALEYPAELDTVVRALSAMEAALPRLLSQLADWLDTEEKAGRVAVAGARMPPSVAALSVRTRLEAAAGYSRQAREELDTAAGITTGLEGTGAMTPAEIEALAADRDRLLALVEYAHHLREHGERAPGGDETWGQWDRDAYTYLQERDRC